MEHLKIKGIFAGVLLAAPLVVGCVSSEEPSANLDDGPSVIRGQLTEEVAGTDQLEGYLVVTSTVSSQGEVTPIEADGLTGAEGDFTVTLDERLDLTDTVLLEATSGDDVIGGVIFNVPAAEMAQYWAPPITIDSTAEARVTVQGRVQEEGCSFCIEGDLETRVDANIAEAMNATGANNPAVYAEVAVAIFAGVQARNEMLLSDDFAIEPAALADAAESTATAKAELERDLALASTAEERRAIHEAYMTAYLNAFDEAGFKAEQLATASHAELSAQAVYGTPSDTLVAAMMQAELETMRARYVSETVENVFEDHGMSSTDVSEAGAELRDEVAIAASMTSDPRSELDQAWERYRDRVFAAVVDDLELAETTAVLELTELLDQETEEFSATLARLDEADDPLDNAAMVAAGVAEFRNAVVSPENETLLIAAGLDAEAANAFLRVMFHINAVVEPSLSLD